MKHFKLIISTVFLLLAAFCCVNNMVETQQAATPEPYINPDSAFVSQSLAFAEEHQWVSFHLSVLRLEESNMLQDGPTYDVIIKYNGENSMVFISDNFNHYIVTKENPEIKSLHWDCLSMAWFYFHPIPFIDTKPYLRQLTSCKKDIDGNTPFFRFESDWAMGQADFMVNAETFTLYRAGHRTYLWNDVYCFHDISFDDRQYYVDSIMTYKNKIGNH